MFQRLVKPKESRPCGHDNRDEAYEKYGNYSLAAAHMAKCDISVASSERQVSGRIDP